MLFCWSFHNKCCCEATSILFSPTGHLSPINDRPKLVVDCREEIKLISDVYLKHNFVLAWRRTGHSQSVTLKPNSHNTDNYNNNNNNNSPAIMRFKISTNQPNISSYFINFNIPSILWAVCFAMWSDTYIYAIQWVWWDNRKMLTNTMAVMERWEYVLCKRHAHWIRNDEYSGWERQLFLAVNRWDYHKSASNI